MRFVMALFLGSIAYSAFGQTVSQKVRHQAFEVPSEVIMPVVAAQSDCPLKFENVRLFVYLDSNGAIADSFDLRNAGIKPIRDYVVAAYSSYGGMWTKGRSRNELAKPILPGTLAPLSDEDDVETVPLTDEIRDRFKLRNREMGGVEVFMVVRVEFTDGTVFTDEKASKALEAYFQKLSEFHSKG